MPRPDSLEIERKWLLRSEPPELTLSYSLALVQYYVAISPGEIRFRQAGDNSFLTIKGDGTLSRAEWETPIPQWCFLQSMHNALGRIIRKQRHIIRTATATLELDIYGGDHQGLIILEAEFEGIATSEAYTLPDWAVAAGALDVTNDKHFKNKELALSGIPKYPH